MATNKEILSLKAWVIKDTDNHRSEPKEITVIRLTDALNAITSERQKIFAELESIKDEYGNSILDTLYGKGKHYAKLKKKY